MIKVLVGAIFFLVCAASTNAQRRDGGSKSIEKSPHPQYESGVPLKAFGRRNPDNPWSLSGNQIAQLEKIDRQYGAYLQQLTDKMQAVRHDTVTARQLRSALSLYLAAVHRVLNPKQQQAFDAYVLKGVQASLRK